MPPVNEQTGQMQTKIKKILSEKKKIYDGPKVYTRNIKQVLIPKDADTADMQELDWVADQYYRTFDWFKRRIGDIEEGKFDEKEVGLLEQDLLRTTIGTSRLQNSYPKALVTEWHGKYDVNDDGLDEEIVVCCTDRDEPLNMDIKSINNNSRLLG